MNKSSSRKGILAIGVLTVTAAVLSICAHLELRFPGDLHLTLLVQSVDSEALDSMMEWVSFLTGDWRAVVLAIAGSIVIWRCLGKRESVLVLMTWLSSPISSGLKLIVGRPRPAADLVRVFQAEPGNSFPSGHAFFATVFWGLLAYFAVTRVHRRSLRMLTLSTFAVIIAWIGVSRVYLGAHWPSDVLGGYVFGALFLTGLVWLDRRWRSGIEAGNPDQPAHYDSQSRHSAEDPAKRDVVLVLGVGDTRDCESRGDRMASGMQWDRHRQ
jgi:membrane-associated phospholipid phosphatase